MIDTRLHHLNDKGVRTGNYVLYWMQASQRAEDNLALETAIAEANCLDLPVLVGFGLMDDYPEANLRHYTFMLEGLKDVNNGLRQRGIKFVVQRGSPDEVAIRLGQDAALVVTDYGYLRLQQVWRDKVANELPCRVIALEDNVVMPIGLVSQKAEYAARTIRPKISRQIEAFQALPAPLAPRHSSLDLNIGGMDVDEPDDLAAQLKLDSSVPAVSRLFRGGGEQAKKMLTGFLQKRFHNYTKNRNQPQTDDSSYMGMYLHFGHISPVYIAQEIRKHDFSRENVDAYIEELIVRRELAMNFVYYTDNYDDFGCLPDWARKTLKEHEDDPREYLYSLEQLEAAQTHDPYWNAAMNEMRYTGYMHNYMRMYWGKKILEWTATPQEAYWRALYLNNRHFLDGRDANSFTGVAWCFGLHDRPWGERPVFGKIRYMNAAGLKRKADPDAYVDKVKALIDKLS